MQYPTGLIPWFSKTEGNTYATIAASAFTLQGKPMQAQDVAGCRVALTDLSRVMTSLVVAQVKKKGSWGFSVVVRKKGSWGFLQE